MADNNQTVVLAFKVDKDTGALSLVGQELGQVGEGANHASEAVNELMGRLGAIVSVGAFIEFMKASFDAAVRHAEATRLLSFSLKENGVAIDANKEKLKQWEEETVTSTRFSGVEFVEALGRASRATKDLEQAHTAVNVAMGLSVGTGKSLEESTSIISSLMAGNAREVRGLSREMSALISPTDTAQEALTKLQGRFEGVAQQETGVARETKGLENQFEEIKEAVGSKLIPVFDALIQKFKSVMVLFEFFKQNPTDIGKLFFGNPEAFYADLDKFVSANKDASGKVAGVWVGAEQQKTAATEHGAALRSKLGITEQAQDLITIKAQIADVQAGEQEKLAQKNLSSAQRLEIVKKALADELKVLDDNQAAYKGKEAMFEAERSKLVAEAAKKRTEIEQKYVIDVTAQLEKIAAENLQVSAKLVEESLKAADTIVKGFGDAFAKTIVENKNFAAQMKAVQTQVEEQIISSIVQIGVKWAVTHAIMQAQSQATSAAAVVATQAQAAAVGELTIALNAATTAAIALDAALAAAA